MSNQYNCLEKEVSIPLPLFYSEEGRYFIGETPELIGENKRTLAALVNPIDSNFAIYLNAITITNISPLNISAEFYVKSTIKNAIPSNSVSCVNLGFTPEPTPKGKIMYIDSPTKPPCDGVSIFSRIVHPYSTEVVDGSQIILQPGQSIAVYLGGYLSIIPNSIIVAFGWWEKRVAKSVFDFNS